jgi:hypothetical protein
MRKHVLARGDRSPVGFLRLSLLLTAIILPVATFTPAALAMEGGQSPYLKGYRDFLSGVLPPPGVQFRQDINVYRGQENSRIPQGQLATDLRNVTSIVALTFVTPMQLWGGNYGFALRGAATAASADRTVTNQVGRNSASGDVTGFNDIVVTPLVLGWHRGNWHWNVSASVWMPAGTYDAGRLVNTGRNFWSWAPQAAVTYLDREKGWEFSAAASYVVNYENTATRYRSGDIAHIDMAAMKAIAPRLWIGAVGYAMSQVTDDSGAGNTLGARKAQVFGAGPAIRYVVVPGKAPVMLTAKYYREFSALNTTEGDAGAISLRFHF